MVGCGAGGREGMALPLPRLWGSLKERSEADVGSLCPSGVWELRAFPLPAPGVLSSPRLGQEREATIMDLACVCSWPLHPAWGGQGVSSGSGASSSCSSSAPSKEKALSPLPCAASVAPALSPRDPLCCFSEYFYIGISLIKGCSSKCLTSAFLQ